MTCERISMLLSEWGLRASEQEVRLVAEDLGRVSAVMDRLRTTIRPADGIDVFEEMLGSSPRWHGFSDFGDLGPEQSEDDPVAAARHALERATASGARLNCFVEVFPDTAEHRARNLADEGRSTRYPLYGIPFAFKDVFVLENRCPTVGIGRGYRWRGPHQSKALQRLLDAGALPIGALNLDPHCYTATGFNPYYGRVLNPHGAAYAVGGSSSGSAAAVASGIVPFALGTDTGGSVRIPASLCGVYGLKPTLGLVQDPGVAPLSVSQDTVGILARTPRLAARVLGVLSEGRRDEADGSADAYASPPVRPGLQTDLGGLRVGINSNELLCGMDEAVTDTFRRALRAIVRLGAEIVEVPFPLMDDLNTCASVITSYEANAVHGVALARHPDFYPPAVRRRLLTAACIDQEDYRAVLRLRGRYLSDVLAHSFANVDVIVCPTIRRGAPRVDCIPDDSDAGGALSVEFLRMNRPFSFLGLPALSLPIGRDGNNIPIGMQVIGRPFADDRLLAFAEVLRRSED